MNKVAVIIPTRGLVTTRCIASVIRSVDWSRGDAMFLTADFPIPDCFNDPIQKALESDDFTHVFIVEEDIVINYNTLDELLKADVDIATCNYNMGHNVKVVSERNGFILAGTGCTLIKTNVLKDLMPFSTDTWYDMDLKPGPKLRDDDYGMHDIDFYIRAQQKGYTVKVVGSVTHLKVEQLGQPGTNNGIHKIVERD